MPRFTVTQIVSGVVLFDGEATDEQDALNRMARDAGYDDYADARDAGDDHRDPPRIAEDDTLVVSRID